MRSDRIARDARMGLETMIYGEQSYILTELPLTISA